jgi:hypothetical protein
MESAGWRQVEVTGIIRKTSPGFRDVHEHGALALRASSLRELQAPFAIF